MNSQSRKFPAASCPNCGITVVFADDTDNRRIALDPHVPVYMLIQLGETGSVRLSKQPRAKQTDKTTLVGYMVAHDPICRGAKPKGSLFCQCGGAIRHTPHSPVCLLERTKP